MVILDMLSIVGFLFVTRIVSISGMNNTIDIYLLFIGNNQSHHHQVNNENGAELAVEESGRNSSNNKGIIGSLKRDECGWGFFSRQCPRIVRQQKKSHGIKTLRFSPR